MNKPDTIDELLRQAIYVTCRGDRTARQVKEEGKAALSAMVAEIIGEDYDRYYFGHNPHDETHSDNLNELLEEQRQRAIAKGFTL